MPQIQYTIEAINQRLKDKRSKARVVLRGKTAINLQATLPAKPMAKGRGRRQQHIPLGLSMPIADTKEANKEKVRILKIAEAQAELLHTDLLYDRFSWDNYNVAGTVHGTPIKELIPKFEEHYRQRNTLKQRTWETKWMRVLRYLPGKEPLSEEVLKSAIARCSKPASITRFRMCQRYRALAEYANIEVDFSEFETVDAPTDEYGLRQIPPDKYLIEHRPSGEGRYQKSQQGWRWIYSVLFVTGARPHEVFFGRWAKDGFEITKGKTGPRVILYEVMEVLTPGLVEEWNLKDIKLPNIRADESYERGKLGMKVNNSFHKQNIPVRPYDIRHAFALRGIKKRVPTSVMALMMGHSEEEHIRTYRKFMDQSRSQDILSDMLRERPN